VYSIGLIINVREEKFHANFDVKNESSRERKFHLSGTKVPVTIQRTSHFAKHDDSTNCTHLLHVAKQSKTVLNDRLGTMLRSDAGVTADNTTPMSSIVLALSTDCGKKSSRLVSFDLASSSIFARR